MLSEKYLDHRSEGGGVRYEDFLIGKTPTAIPTGVPTDHSELPRHLFDFQRDITAWALKRGRAAVFADCGLGKTPMQLAWADRIAEHTDGRVLLLAPLAVAQQTIAEAAKFGVNAEYARDSGDTADARVVVTNYERLERFDPEAFAGIVLDESSILKSFDGKTRTALIDAFASTPYRLACTATPAPNDFMELGNHAEFLGVLTRAEMLATFFVHDGGETQKWRLKGHAEKDFWKWLGSWAVLLRSPADLGYDATQYNLPPCNVEQVIVASDAAEGELFATTAATLQERIVARRTSVEARVAACAELVNKSDGPFLVWCQLNAESEGLCDAIEGAVEVTGSDSPEEKERAMLGFQAGTIRVLVTKPSIAGFGMNWQHCSQMAFVGLSDSWEQYYQAVRRCWRFGQSRQVNVYIITAETEGAVVANIKRKEEDATRMAEAMLAHTRTVTEAAIKGQERANDTYQKETAEGNGWTMHLADCVEATRGMEASSIDFSIFSPPFASLYTYSNSERDMGNVRSHSEFFAHFSYLVSELFRVTKDGRLCSFHCMNLPTSKVRDGVIGLSDFRGELIRMFQAVGWIYHSEVVIWKDPVTAMQRTKALGLLHKTIRKDSSMSRQGIPDYLVTMRKPGENLEPIAHTADEFPVSLWQRYASPIWMDIDPSDTLQYRSAREHNDERHICPLQLQVIRRALMLWSNPGDLVLSPFAGIGSEGVVAIEARRRFVGVELKRSYWGQAVKNLTNAKAHKDGDLFAGVA